MIIMCVCNSFLEYHFIFVLSLSDLWEIHKSVMIMELDRASSSVQWQTPANTKMQKYIFQSFVHRLQTRGGHVREKWVDPVLLLMIIMKGTKVLTLGAGR